MLKVCHSSLTYLHVFTPPFCTLLHTPIPGPWGTPFRPPFWPLLRGSQNGPFHGIHQIPAWALWGFQSWPFLGISLHSENDENGDPFFSCFGVTLREIVTLCFHLLPFSFKTDIFDYMKIRVSAPCLDWYPNPINSCDSTVGPGTLSGPPPWLGWMVTTYPSWDGEWLHRDITQRAIDGHSMAVPTTLCGICHHVP